MVGEPVEARRLDHRAPVEDDPLHGGVVDQPAAAPPAERADRVPLGGLEHGARGHRGVHHEQRAGAIARRGLEHVEVQAPGAVATPEGHEDGRRAGHPHAADHADVGRVGDDDLVALLHGGEQRVEQPLGAAAGDDHVLLGVVGDAGLAQQPLGDGLAELGQPVEGQVGVGRVDAHAGARGLEHRGGRRHVGVEVLQAQDIGVGARGAGGGVDAELGEVQHPARAVCRRSGHGSRRIFQIGRHRVGVANPHGGGIECVAPP